MKRFNELVVVELSGSVAGAYCGKLFADNGAHVTLVGDSSLTESETIYLHDGKALADVGDLSEADVVIESSAPDPLVPVDLGASSAAHVQISPFGVTGPYARWSGTDIVDYAVSGHLYLYGDPAREPLNGPASQPAYATALYAFIGAMAALLARERTGLAQTVEVSHAETMVALHQFTLIRYFMSGDVLCRMGNRYTGLGQPNAIYECSDGWVSVCAPWSDMIERLLAITGLEHLLDHPDIKSPQDFQTYPALFDDAFGPWLAEREVDFVVDLFQAARIPTSPVLTMLGVLDDPHLAEREYWRSVGGYTVPGPPFRLTSRQRNGAAAERQDEPLPDAPLAGVRVLDLCRVWAGPIATRTFADLGADVVWVEAPWSRGPKELPQSLIAAAGYYADNDPKDCQWNRNGHWLKYALGKRSLVLDLSKSEGVDTFKRMVPSVDVIVENYSPRVMPQLGLDEDRLHELNPGVVYVTMPGFGRSGPAEHWLAFGSSVDSHAGLSSLIGYPEQCPWKGAIAWPDPIAGLHAVGATLIARWDQQAVPGTEGITIEVSQFESMIAVLGDALVAAQIDGDPPTPWNRDPRHVPQGVYPCQGVDRWIAISVTSDEAWASLRDLAGLTDDLRSDHGALDEALSAWTAGYEHRELMETLQEAGVAAGAVLDAGEVCADPHLEARGAFIEVDQPQVGPFIAPLTPIHLSATPAAVRGSAPMFGQHNEEVLRDWAGLDAAEIAALVDAGIVATEPPE